MRRQQIFSPAELDVLLCGERSIEWDKASLQEHIKLVSNEQGLSLSLSLSLARSLSLSFPSPSLPRPRPLSPLALVRALPCNCT